MIPKWLEAFANEDDLRAVENAVAAAEAKTAGEIVPMIVKESTPSGHVPVLVMLVWFAFFMAIAPFVTHYMPLESAWLYDILAAVLSALLGWFRAGSPAVRRIFTTRNDQAHSVFTRAQLEFFQTGIPSTHARTGILIFVSLQERRAVILGDEAISAKIKDEAWLEIINGLLAHMKAKRLKEGYSEAIAKVGEILAREFPVETHDTNELPNNLVVKI